MRRQEVSFMTGNANYVSDKIASIAHTTYKKNFDVLHITEAGLGKKLPDTIKGYIPPVPQQRIDNVLITITIRWLESRTLRMKKYGVK